MDKNPAVAIVERQAYELLFELLIVDDHKGNATPFAARLLQIERAAGQYRKLLAALGNADTMIEDGDSFEGMMSGPRRQGMGQVLVNQAPDGDLTSRMLEEVGGAVQAYFANEQQARNQRTQLRYLELAESARVRKDKLSAARFEALAAGIDPVAARKELESREPVLPTPATPYHLLQGTDDLPRG